MKYMIDPRFKLGEELFKAGRSLNYISKELKITKNRMSKYLKDQGYIIEPAFKRSDNEKN